MAVLTTKKELRRANKQLIRDHRALFASHIKRSSNLNLEKRTMLLQRYDSQIKPKNIRAFYNRHMDLFTTALLFNCLDNIAQYTNIAQFS